MVCSRAPWPCGGLAVASRSERAERCCRGRQFRRVPGGSPGPRQPIRPATTSGYTIRWSPFWTPASTSVQLSSSRRPPSLWSRE